MSSVAVATVTFPGLTADAQDKARTQKAERDRSSIEPGPENRPLYLVLCAAPQVLLAFSLSQWISHCKTDFLLFLLLRSRYSR